MQAHTILYGEGEIAFTLIRSEVLKSKIKIDVEPDGQVQVHAPTDSPLTTVKQAVLQRAHWIDNHVTQTLRRMRDVRPRRYVSGETHWYLGKRYLLKVRVAESQPCSAKLLRGMLWVTVPEYSQTLVKQELDAWYRHRAIDVFQRQLVLICATLPWVKQPPESQLLQMRKQWGSCSPKGRLSLNPSLVKAPRVCIDYVLAHELCHLKHHNHSKEF